MRPHLSRFLLLVAAAASLLFSGCLSTSKIRGIAVELVDVQATPAPNGGAELAFSIRYINENLVPIGAAGSRHQISLNGVELPRINSEEPIGLPPMNEVTQAVTLRVDAGTVARLREMQAAGQANYQLQSLILVEAGAQDMESKTSGSGTVDLSDLGL